MNNKGADQSAQMHRRVCAFVVRKPRRRQGQNAVWPDLVLNCKGYQWTMIRVVAWLLLSSAGFFFQEIVSGTLSECQTV